MSSANTPPVIPPQDGWEQRLFNVLPPGGRGFFPMDGLTVSSSELKDPLLIEEPVSRSRTERAQHRKDLLETVCSIGTATMELIREKFDPSFPSVHDHRTYNTKVTK